MPVVPVKREVRRAALPGVRLTAAETAGSQGAGLAQAQAQTGQAMAQMGGVVANAGFQVYSAEMQAQRDRADQVAILEAQRKLGEWENKRITEALTLQGKDAMGLPEEIAGEFEKITGEIESGLGTERQRQLFARMKTDRGLGIDLTLRRHVAKEMDRYETEELKGALSTMLSSGVIHANDPKRVFAEMNQGIEAIRAHGKHTGQGPAAIEDRVTKFQTEMHTGVIERLLNNENDRAAKAYFEETKDQISGDAIANIEKAIEAGSLRGESQRQADALIASGKTFAEQREAAKQLEPKLRQEVLQLLEHENQVQQRAQREQHEAWTTEGRNIIDRTGNWRSIPQSIWRQLTIEETAALKSYAEHKVSQTPIKTDPAVYYELSQLANSSDPQKREAFQKMNLMQHVAHLSTSDFQQFADAQSKGRAGDEDKARALLVNAAVQNQMVDEALVSMGFDPSPPQPGAKKFDKEAAYRIGEFRRSVREAVSRLEQEQKKPATDEQVQSIVDRMRTPVGEKIIADGWFTDTKATAYAFETAQAQASKAADIPHGERAKIEAALQKNNVPVTDETILRIFNLQLAKTRKDR